MWSIDCHHLVPLNKLGGTNVSSNPLLFCAYSWFKHIHDFRTGGNHHKWKSNACKYTNCVVLYIEGVILTLWRTNIFY